MQVQTLIIGQGLCGTWLSYWLQQRGHSFLVLDQPNPQSPSRIASGVVNPVTGRVLAETWMAEQLLPFALEHYRALGAMVGLEVIQKTSILHCFPAQQMRDVFLKKQEALPQWLETADPGPWRRYFRFQYGTGGIRPALLIDLNGLLYRWREKLQRDNLLRETVFDPALMDTSTGIRYEDIRAERIIFCDGTAAMQYRYFEKLPFAPNKGEALLLEVEELPAGRIYKKGISLVPFPHYQGEENNRYFWAGSTYDNRYTETGPTAAFREKTLAQLQEWLLPGFRLVDHWAGIRPATLDRRPFAGMHPQHPRIGMLNGMGTKGCSLAPWFAHQLAGFLVDGSPLQPEAALTRFARLLG